MMKKQYLCIFFPWWSSELWKKSQEKLHEKNGRQTDESLKGGVADGSTALLFYSKSGNEIIVSRFCKTAHLKGVRCGTSLPMATVLASGDDGTKPLCLPFNAGQDFEALCRTAVWALKLSPLVSIDEELLSAWQENALRKVSPAHDGIIVDVTGTERVHKSFKDLAERLFSSWSRRGFSVRLAIAPTVGAAWALSRFGHEKISILEPDCRLETVLAPLPVMALRLPSETLLSLKELGIERINDLLKLNRSSVQSRLGPFVIKRIDQALGTLPEVLRFAKTKETFEAERSFDIPLKNRESFQHVSVELLKAVIAKLEEKSKKASSFIIEIEALDGGRVPFCTRKEISLFHASKKESHLTSVLVPVIESLKTEEGITKICIRAKFLSPGKAGQDDMLDPDREDNSTAEKAGETLNVLTVRLGGENVTKVQFEASWVPENSFSYRPVKYSTPLEKIPPHVASDRPPYFLNPPQPASVIALLPDSPPARITWQGETLKVIAGTGPERISMEWWQDSLEKTIAANNGLAVSFRDYFKVQDETGRWLWIYRENQSSSWFVQGVWL